MKLRPEILTHPNIPKPLHGINPRSIMGQEWWDLKRKEVYAKNNFRCIACGVHKNNAKKHKWLEAHEFYNINYKKGIVEIVSIESLCHFCHNFIHSGRLKAILGKDKSLEEVRAILEHGFEILSQNNLKCFPGTLSLGKNLFCNTFGVVDYKIPKSEAKWSDWLMIFEGKEFKSKFNSYENWQDFYNKKGE
jgi:hypothetical protein